MTINYFRIAWRGLQNNPFFSAINIIGLAVGMGTVILIGLWMFDELSFNKYHENYDRIAQVMRHSVVNAEINSQKSMPIPLRQELGNKYPGDFKHIVLSLPASDHVLSSSETKFTTNGRFMEPEAAEMLTLEMLKGTLYGLKKPSSILLSESASRTLFGDADPINKTLLIDNKMEVSVTGVYLDIPHNSQFKDLMFIAPWDLHLANNAWAQNAQGTWGINSFEIFVQLIPNVGISQVSAKIKNTIRDNIDPKLAEARKPEVFLHPMSHWHLYSEWKNGVNIGGRIQFVWLFGIIAIFVLILACINFMNLSTARSEKRAKEVGIRKVVGSTRRQLIKQFFSESILLAMFGFIFSLLLVELSLPFFNELADKRMTLQWTSPLFLILGLGFTLLTGLIAGSYPVLYLSSFQPIKVLKGIFYLNRFSALPRKVLVVLQFTVSTSLIIGTIVVYNQIQFAKNRPVGYNRDRLLIIQMTTPEIRDHYEAIRNDLLGVDAVASVAASQNPTTEVWDNRNGFEWSNKASNSEANFATMAVTHEYGKTVGWEFTTGRDFSRDFSTDISASIVLNESAAKFMGFENPINETVTSGGQNFRIIGVIEDMVMTSPYEPVKPTIFYLNYENSNFINIKMLSKDFVVPVMISCFVAIPISYYFLEQWLLNYEYRTGIAWWVFGTAFAGTLIITLLTVSFQAIKSAMAYPINSLRTE